jgi:hypothetical protein
MCGSHLGVDSLDHKGAGGIPEDELVVGGGVFEWFHRLFWHSLKPKGLGKTPFDLAGRLRLAGSLCSIHESFYFLDAKGGGLEVEYHVAIRAHRAQVLDGIKHILLPDFGKWT